jgi:hypothetical protein
MTLPPGALEAIRAIRRGLPTSLKTGPFTKEILQMLVRERLVTKGQQKSEWAAYDVFSIDASGPGRVAIWTRGPLRAVISSLS